MLAALLNLITGAGHGDKQLFFDNIAANLATDLPATNTAILLTQKQGGWPVALDPNTYFELTISDLYEKTFEVVHVTGVAGDMLTVLRGQANTTAKDWKKSACMISGRLTARALLDFARRSEDNVFTAHNVFQKQIVIDTSGEEPSVVRGKIAFEDVSGAERATLAGDGGLFRVSGPEIMVESPELQFNGLYWPEDGSLLNNQNLFVDDNGRVVGQPPEFFIGAYAYPPLHNNFGDPLPVGALYYDLTRLSLRIWTGLFWRDFTTAGPGVTRTWTRTVTTFGGETVFDLTTPDDSGNTYAFNQISPESVIVYVNGVRVVEGAGDIGDFTVSIVDSTITFDATLPVGTVVMIDQLVSADQLSPGALIATRMAPLLPTGVDTTFQLVSLETGDLFVANSAEDLMVSVNGVVQEPGEDYDVSGSDLIFTVAPEATAIVWVRAYYSVAAPIKFGTCVTWEHTVTTFGGEAVFNIGTPDDMGKTFLFDPVSPTGIRVYVNGIRVVAGSGGSGDYTVDINLGLVTFDATLPVGTVVSVEQFLSEQPKPTIASQTTLRDLTALINRYDKYAGKMVWDTTNIRPVFAVGENPSSIWVNADGSSAHIPV